MGTLKCFVCAELFFKPLIGLKMHLRERKQLHKTPEGNSGKTNTRK